MKNKKYLKKLKLNKNYKNVIIDKNSFDECINKYHLERYKNQFHKNLLGGKLIDELNEKGYIILSKILIWIFYSTSVLSLIKLIKEYFKEIFCVDYKDNNFVFKIKRNREEGEKTIGFLFGLIEDNKNEFKIGFYSLQYSSLEQIFNKFAKEKEDNEINEIEVEIGKDFTEIFDDIQ